jgi:hypothetical protein
MKTQKTKSDYILIRANGTLLLAKGYNLKSLKKDVIKHNKGLLAKSPSRFVVVRKLSKNSLHLKNLNYYEIKEILK